MWKRIRDREARLHPYCEICLQKGIKKPTETVHHIKTLSQGGTHVRENLICLCFDCHDILHERKN